MKIAVIGSGSWGTAVAALAAANGPAMLWSRREDVANAINVNHENPRYVQGFKLPTTLRASADLEQVIDWADALAVGVPSHGLRDALSPVADEIVATTPIVSLSKGIEENTLMRMTEVISNVLPDHDPRRIGVLSGPNLAKEILAGQPAATVVAMADAESAAAIQSGLMSPTFRVYTNNDVVGCEVAGAAKNVMAIASGIATGLGLGDNTRAMLVTRALAEITRLGVALGGSPFTFGGLAGIGDLIATCYSSQSRNYTVGYGLGTGSSLEDVIAEMNMVAEGVKSTKGILELAHQAGIEMPIAEQVGAILYNGADPEERMRTLMTRDPKDEGHGIV